MPYDIFIPRNREDDAKPFPRKTSMKSNLFFRTCLTSYRLDTYNSFHRLMNCELYFYWGKKDMEKAYMKSILAQCNFTPFFLKGWNIVFRSRVRKVCTNIGSLLKKHQPDFVIVPEFQLITFQVLLYKFLHRKSFKVISMCDDSYDMVANNNDFSPLHKIGRKLCLPLLDNIILVDSKATEWYQSHYQKGIWLPILRDEAKEEARYQRLIPLSNKLNILYGLTGQKVVLYVGRLVTLKNLCMLLEAFEKTTEDAVLVIVGKGEEEATLKRKASSMKKRVVFTGYLTNDELYAWYNISDVFCLISYIEPFGAVVNEALLAGNRIVISEKAGSNCIVNSNNGQTVSPFDQQEIAQAIDNQLRSTPLKGNTITYKGNLMSIHFMERINHLKKTIYK